MALGLLCRQFLPEIDSALSQKAKPMTCIVAMIDSQGVDHIAGDSFADNGHYHAGLVNERVFRLRRFAALRQVSVQ